MDEGHAVLNIIEHQDASRVVHVHADPCGFRNVERRLHVAVPCREAPAIPLQTPGEVVSCDATVALRTLAVNALVRQAHMSALPSQIHLEVMPAHVEALHRQHLTTVLEALGQVRVVVLPRRRIRDLPFLFCQTQELMHRVCIQVKRRAVCKRGSTTSNLAGEFNQNTFK